MKPTHTLEQSFTSQLGIRPISAIEKLEQSVNQPEFLKLVGDLKESFQTELEEFRAAAAQSGRNPTVGPDRRSEGTPDAVPQNPQNRQPPPAFPCAAGTEA